MRTAAFFVLVLGLVFMGACLAAKSNLRTGQQPPALIVALDVIGLLGGLVFAVAGFVLWRSALGDF